MKFKEGVMIHEVAGNAFIIPNSAAENDFGKIIKLNNTGKVICESLLIGLAEKDIVRKLVNEYDVTEEEAKEDVYIFLSQLDRAGFLE